VTDVRGEVLAGRRTDGLGEFAITDLVPGTVTLAVNSPKHRPTALPVEIGGTGTTRVQIELRPGAQVWGTVRGAGNPLGDAVVTLVDVAGNVIATTTTAPDGAYIFSDLDTGTYTITATGYPPRASTVAHSLAAKMAHGTMPLLWVVFSEIAAHVYAVRIGAVTGRRMEKIRFSRWLLAPLSTFALWRRMTLWEVTSYADGARLRARAAADPCGPA
jgi:hypothetical protein